MKTYRDIIGDGGSNVVAQVTEHAQRLERRLASVRHVVAVMSGKGGVGKSTLTVNLAQALALSGHAVGLLDADLNGPSVAKMTGVRGQPLTMLEEGVRPAEAALGVRVMSMDLFLPDDRTPVVWDAPTQKDAFAWRGMMEAQALREFLADTAWGTLDFLLIDLPPGSDKLPNVADMLPKLAGVIVVTIPTEVSGLVVGKSIEMARSLVAAPVLGIVENMSGYICPNCGEEKALFPKGKVEALAAEHGLPYLGALPFDPRLAAAADAGRCFLNDQADTPAGLALRTLAERIEAALA